LIMIDVGRGGAGTESGAQVSLVDAVVVAGPVQLHRLAVDAVLALALVPDRREVGRAEPLSQRKGFESEVQPRLRGVPCIDAPRSIDRRINSHETVADGEELRLHDGNAERADHAVDHTQPAGLPLDLRTDHTGSAPSVYRD